MERFEVELDKLAEVGYRDLPTAANYVDGAELFVARCDGLNNRRIFVAVDDEWAHLRDFALRTSLRRMQQSLEDTAEALRGVHARYGGADESASMSILQIEQDRRDQAMAKLDDLRDQQERREQTEGVDIDTAEEISQEAFEDNFVPFTRD